ncbi:MAG TPA: c(7)-type cytochrome triheme domain-containing protein [Methylomirabilota bacterium]|nr:c(7)-type cytochrome triheme domain-containing protein [Methylomirabilota bacterium]
MTGPRRVPGPFRRGVAALAVALGALTAPGSTAGVAQVKVPPDFQFPKSEASPGEVTFSHAAHRARVDKCSACHMRDFKLQRGGSGPITLAAKQEGKFCGACHDGKTTMGGTAVFPIDECDRCHK